MKKIELADIKEHFSYCIDEGLTIGEQEERFLHWLYNKIEKQQQEIEKRNDVEFELKIGLQNLKEEIERLEKCFKK